LKKKKELEPLNSVIQVCSDCGKVDAYAEDGHDCIITKQNQEAQEYYD
jgi:hypothetical protein